MYNEYTVIKYQGKVDSCIPNEMREVDYHYRIYIAYVEYERACEDFEKWKESIKAWIDIF